MSSTIVAVARAMSVGITRMAFETVFKDVPGQIVQGAQSAWPTLDGEIQTSFLSQAYGDVTRIVDVRAVAPYLDIARQRRQSRGGPQLNPGCPAQ